MYRHGDFYNSGLGVQRVERGKTSKKRTLCEEGYTMAFILRMLKKRYPVTTGTRQESSPDTHY